MRAVEEVPSVTIQGPLPPRVLEGSPLPSRVGAGPRMRCTPELNCGEGGGRGEGGRQLGGAHCIDGNGLGGHPSLGDAGRVSAKRKGKETADSRVFPDGPRPAPSAARRPRAPPAGERLQHVLSTCCRWRRTSAAVSQGTTLARKELGSAFCASWMRRCMG